MGYLTTAGDRDFLLGDPDKLARGLKTERCELRLDFIAGVAPAPGAGTSADWFHESA